MNLYLVTGYLDVAATTLADAQALLAALADPSIAANAATIDRVTDKVETLVQADSGEPITLVSIDDTTGAVSSWITDGSTTVAAGLGYPDATTTLTYAGPAALSVSGNTRTGTLALNTAALRDALYRAERLPACLVLHVRKTVGGVTETVALLPITVRPGVLSATFA